MALLIFVGSHALAESAQSDPPLRNAGNDVKRPISPHFMDLIAHWYDPWPQETFSSLRLWDTGTAWSDINTGPGQYDWTAVDGWMQAASQNHVGILFTLGLTPQWASSDPNNPDCNNGPGQCAPPDDLNPDGTGPDQHWKNFVTALVDHVGTQVHTFEIWNEANNPRFFSGTTAQLVRMSQDAYTIIHAAIPAARVLNAGTAAQQNQYGMNWWKAYAAAGGLKYADVIAFHGCVESFPTKCGEYPQPETIVSVMSSLHGLLDQYGQGRKSIWDTEASWGKTKEECFTDQDLQAAFLARFYLLHRSSGVNRFFWRAWIDGDGGLYLPGKGINKAGIAYQQIENWIVGRTLTNACSSQGTIWTCNFSGAQGYAAQAIWDTSESCHNGTCRTHPYQVEGQFVDYLTLAGNKFQIRKNQVPIGAKPILVEN
jgi:hypothetical protein